MLWGRFINHEEKVGQNISSDLHMEHLNRSCKDAVKHLGANKTPKAIVRCSKALGGLTAILKHFDDITGISVCSSHSRKSDFEDLSKIVGELMEKKVFCNYAGREHSRFPNFKSNSTISSINKEKFQEWIKRNVNAQIDNSFFS